MRAGGVAQTDRRYTGQRQEAAQPALGLYDYRARYYSTLMGRFVSADPAFPRGSPMPLNRFAYANDNPLRFLDPSGYAPTQQDLNNCARNLVACIEWSHGVAPDREFSLIIVMGLSESNRSEGDLDRYWAYGETFLGQYVSGCGGALVTQLAGE